MKFLSMIFRLMHFVISNFSGITYGHQIKITSILLLLSQSAAFQDQYTFFKKKCKSIWNSNQTNFNLWSWDCPYPYNLKATLRGNYILALKSIRNTYGTRRHCPYDQTTYFLICITFLDFRGQCKMHLPCDKIQGTVEHTLPHKWKKKLA